MKQIFKKKKNRKKEISTGAQLNQLEKKTIISLSRMMVKGQARNCNIKHSLTQQRILFFLHQTAAGKQQQQQHTMAPCCHQFACIHQNRFQGKSSPWQVSTFLSILFEAVGASITLVFGFPGLQGPS